MTVCLQLFMRFQWSPQSNNINNLLTPPRCSIELSTLYITIPCGIPLWSQQTRHSLNQDSHFFSSPNQRYIEKAALYEAPEGFVVSWGGSIMGLVDFGNRLGWWISRVEAPSKQKANRSRLQPVISSTCSHFALTLFKLYPVSWHLICWELSGCGFLQTSSISGSFLCVFLIFLGLWSNWIATSNVFDMCFMPVSIWGQFLSTIPHC